MPDKLALLTGRLAVVASWTTGCLPTADWYGHCPWTGTSGFRRCPLCAGNSTRLSPISEEMPPINWDPIWSKTTPW